MSSWFIPTMKWGGAAMIIMFSAALVFVTFVTETKNVPLKAGCWGFIVIGLALIGLSYFWERKYLEDKE